MKREIINLCPVHRQPHEKCPSDCGHVQIYFDRIEKVKRIIAKEILEEQKAAAKLEKAAAKAVVPVFKCQFCDCSFQGKKRKFCTIRCRSNALNQRLRERPKLGWVPKIKSCEKCGTEFLALQKATRLCGKACRSIKKPIPTPRKTKPCAECGDQHQRKRFCSDSCQRKNENKRTLKPKKIHSHCSQCGKDTNHHRKYCSEKCERKADRTRAKAKKSPVIPKLKKLSCKSCGKEFETFYPTKEHCSQTCSNRTRRRAKRAREKGKPRSNHVRIKNRLSGRLRELLRREGKQKTNAIGAYMGCTPKEMLAHVDKQLEGTAMNWSNYGVFGWHLDHIIPCKYFDLSNEAHLAVCFNWRNIRPLWGVDNVKRQADVSLLDALEIPKELFDMATNLGIKLWL